jgi:hypothetical protein
VPAGSQSARCGGTTQSPSRVAMIMTPDLAKASCARLWVCQGTTLPGAKSLGMTAIGRGTS